jgi:hypothetical protein
LSLGLLDGILLSASLLNVIVSLRKSQYANVSLEREIIRAAASSKCRIFLFNLPEKDASRLPEFERANDK